MGIVDRRLTAHRRRTLMAGISGVIFCRSGWGGGKIHLWMRVRMIRTDLLRMRALWLIPGRAVRILRGRVRGRSILVVPLRMLRGCLMVRGVSAHRWNDCGRGWRL